MQIYGSMIKPARLQSLDNISNTWAIIPEYACIQTSKEVMFKLLDKELTWNDEPVEILSTTHKLKTCGLVMNN